MNIDCYYFCAYSACSLFYYVFDILYIHEKKVNLAAVHEKKKLLGIENCINSIFALETNCNNSNCTQAQHLYKYFYHLHTIFIRASRRYTSFCFLIEIFIINDVFYVKGERRCRSTALCILMGKLCVRHSTCVEHVYYSH